MVGADTPDRGRGWRPVLDTLPVFAALGGALGLVYGIGGAVVWLRFNHQGLPADQAVALVPKADLLVIGMRVMVLPAIAAGLVLLGLASIRHTRAREFAVLSEKHDRLEKDPGARDREREMAEIETRLSQLRQRPRPLDALPGWALRPAQILLALAVLALALVLPFSVGAYAWPVVLVALVAYWLRLRREAPIGGDRDFPIWRIAAAGVIAAAIITVARQIDPPIQLPRVQVVAENVTGLPRSLVVDSGDRGQRVELSGVLVTATDRQVAIGDPVERTIVIVPRAQVTSMIVGPALDVRAPPQSLLSRAFWKTPWAATPLEFWCMNERYGWTRIFNACEGHARIEKAHLALRRGGAVEGVQISCPEEAATTCRGFFMLRTSGAQAGTDGAKTLVAATEPAGYAVTPGQSTEIELSLAGDGIRRQWAGKKRASVRLVLALDAQGDAVIFDQSRPLVLEQRPPRRLAQRENRRDSGKSAPDEQPGTGPAAPTEPDDGSGAERGDDGGDPAAEDQPGSTGPAPPPERSPAAAPPQDETLRIPSAVPGAAG